MGHLSASHLAAVGIGSMIFNFIYWNMGFLRMGTTGITAQAFGGKQRAKIRDTLVRSILIAFMIALIILLFRNAILKSGFVLMNVGESYYDMAWAYCSIRIWAAPATLALYSLFGWYFGMQNAIIPLVITLVLNIVNILCSLYFVRVLDMGAEGVALGTLIAQYSGLILGLLFLVKYKGYFKQFRMSVLFEMDALLSFLRINVDIFIRTLSLTSVFAFFYSMSAVQGSLILAANTILMQFLNWMSYGIDGFAYAAESMVGKYKGASDEHKLMKSIKLSFMWAFVLAVLTAAVYGLKGELLLRIFTNDIEVIEMAASFLFWMALFPIIGFASYIWDGIYIGLTASKAMRNSMLISMIFFFASFYALRTIWPVHSLWIALLIFLLVRAIIQDFLFRRKGLQLK